MRGATLDGVGSPVDRGSDERMAQLEAAVDHVDEAGALGLLEMRPRPSPSGSPHGGS